VGRNFKLNPFLMMILPKVLGAEDGVIYMTKGFDIDCLYYRNRSNKKGNLKISPKLSGGKRSVRSSKKSSPVNTKKNSLLHRKSASEQFDEISP
jgi:hypothetical protein